MVHEIDLRTVVINHFDALAKSYDLKAQNRKKYLEKIDSIAATYILAEGKRNPFALDAGTGTGTRLAGLRQRIPHTRVIGCDISSEMARIASGKDIDGITIADMPLLPFKETAFDYVFCFFNALGYVSSAGKRLETLKEFYRVLRPGGTAMIDVLNRWHTGEALGFKKSKRQIAKELAHSHAASDLETGDVLFSLQMNGDILPGYFHSFTKREAGTQFKQAGFEIEDFQIIGYDSGQTHTNHNKGNFFYILRKPEV